MNKEKSILIEAASLLFRQRGLRNVNLADIALEAGIPLKDLRLQFHTKNEMIVALVDTALVRNNGSLQVNPLLSPTAVTELNNFFQYMENLLEEFPPAFLFQLQKFYPVAWISFRAISETRSLHICKRIFNVVFWKGITGTMLTCGCIPECISPCWGIS